MNLKSPTNRVPTVGARSSGPSLTEEFPLECPGCGDDNQLIAFITDPVPIRKILAHLGEPLESTPVSPARGPPTDWKEFVQPHDDRAASSPSSSGGCSSWSAPLGQRLPKGHWPTYPFNLATDLGEQHDLAAEQPAKLAEIKELYEAWSTEVDAACRKLGLEPKFPKSVKQGAAK